MHKKHFIQLLIVNILIIAAGCEDQTNSPYTRLTGPYLGQTAPGLTPELFAPRIISTCYKDLCISFTPDAKEVFFTLGGFPQSVILNSKEINGRWSNPEVVSFSGKYSSESILNHDGSRMYLGSGTPATIEGKPASTYNIWVTTNENGIWTTPVKMPFPINSDDYSSVYPTTSRNENLYFCSAKIENGLGGGDIWMSENKDGEYFTLTNPGKNINSTSWDIDPFISPNESYIIFSSNRDGGYGSFDLYISFKDETNSWREAVNLGEEINSSSHDIHPYVTSDEKYLFFCSTRQIKGKGYSEEPITLDEKLDALKQPGNGWEDIYWVSTKALFDLRSEKSK